MTVFIAIPAYDGAVNASLTGGLVQFAADSMKVGRNFSLRILPGCALIDHARNVLVAHFLASGADRLLFIDADMVITATQMDRLLEGGARHEVVGAAYPLRQDAPAAFTFSPPEDGKLRVAEGRWAAVSRLGAGFLTVNRRALETLISAGLAPAYRSPYGNPEGLPLNRFFETRYDDSTLVSEDYVFCDKLRAAGFSPMVDLDIAPGHLGQKIYAHSLRDHIARLPADTPMDGAARQTYVDALETS